MYHTIQTLIVLSGGIGVGKSTILKKIESRHSYPCKAECVGILRMPDCDILQRFYEEKDLKSPLRLLYSMQIQNLMSTSRFYQLVELLKTKTPICYMERFFLDDFIFASAQYVLKTWEAFHFKLYLIDLCLKLSIFSILIPKNTIIKHIYIISPLNVCIGRLKKRNEKTKCDQEIDEGYLKTIHDLHDYFFNIFKNSGLIVALSEFEKKYFPLLNSNEYRKIIQELSGYNFVCEHITDVDDEEKTSIVNNLLRFFYLFNIDRSLLFLTTHSSYQFTITNLFICANPVYF